MQAKNKSIVSRTIFSIGQSSLLTVLALILTSQAVFAQLLPNPYPRWTMFHDLSGVTTELIDLAGNPAHRWTSEFKSGHAIYLLDNGKLLRTTNDPSVQPFGTGGVGGRLQILAWDSTVEWNYVVAGKDFVQHHDVALLPNGNILAIVWERYYTADIIAAGRNPANAPSELWSEAILEIEPSGATGGNIVWSWRAWDHLVQNFNPELPNFGQPADHPDKIDINFPANDMTDWLHFNAVDYNADLDQILVGGTRFHEVWVISHATGEIVYRWGNPRAYGRGTQADQKLVGQHNPNWIPFGLPGEGNILVFNNGGGAGSSTVDEIVPPLNENGTYVLKDDQPYGPEQPVWTCQTIDGNKFISPIMGGVQRLPNGNTLVCVTIPGDYFEIDNDCSSHWAFEGPVSFRATRFGTFDNRLKNLLWNMIASEQLNVFRGREIGGSLIDTFESDDMYFELNPDITLSPSEPPVWLEFESTLSHDSPTSLSLRMEANVNTQGLRQSIEFFNYDTGSYELLDIRSATIVDSIVEVMGTGDISRFVETGTGHVKTRIGWITQGGPLLVNPWQVNVDQVAWLVVP